MKTKKNFSLLCLAAGLGNLYFRMPQELPAQAAVLVGIWQSLLLFLVMLLLRKAGGNWKDSALIRWLLLSVFLYSAGADLMDLNRFYQTAYPQQLPGWVLSLLMLGSAAILAKGELRTLKNLTRVVFPLLVISLVLLILSCWNMFHLNNLISWGWSRISREMFSLQNLMIWPEYLALAIWVTEEGKAPLLWVPLVRAGVCSVILVMAELAFGNRGARWPAQSLSLLGQLSVFNRLEWIQITVWLLLLMTRLAFYLYLSRSILGKSDSFLLAGAAWAVSIGLTALEPEIIWQIQQAALWAAAGIILVRGVCRWDGSSRQLHA